MQVREKQGRDMRFWRLPAISGIAPFPPHTSHYHSLNKKRPFWPFSPRIGFSSNWLRPTTFFLEYEFVLHRKNIGVLGNHSFDSSEFFDGIENLKKIHSTNLPRILIRWFMTHITSKVIKKEKQWKKYQVFEELEFHEIRILSSISSWMRSTNIFIEIASDPHWHIFHLYKNKVDSTLNSLGIGIFGILKSISRVWCVQRLFLWRPKLFSVPNIGKLRGFVFDWNSNWNFKFSKFHKFSSNGKWPTVHPWKGLDKRKTMVTVLFESCR